MLAHNGITFEARDIFAKPLSAEEIRGLAEHASVAEIFSWRSPTAKARGLQPGEKSDDDLVALMAEEPRLIRRPLILAGERLVIGADAKVIAGLGAKLGA